MQAEAAFSPDINDINIHSSVLWYQSYINSVIEGLKWVCGCCSLFISKKESQIYAIDNYLIRNSITLRLLTFSHINYYAISDNNICFCLICSRLLLLENKPKFGIFNGFPRVDYQLYPLALANFFVVEEVAIACAHPVVFILKLRPSRDFNPTIYSCIKEHIVFLL